MSYIRRKPYRILVGIDGSNSSMHSADYAISIARKNNSQLIALHVLFSEFEFKKIKEFYKSIFSNVFHSTDYGQSQVRY
ncbi:MAG: universal stress protein, partial [Nitrososphaeraceae archaeon]